MILLCGIRSEPPLAMVAAALEAEKAEFRLVHQRDVSDYRIGWHSTEQGTGGDLVLGDEHIDLDNVTGLYLRLMDYTKLPELADLPAESPLRRRANGFHDALVRWSEVSPAQVVNRADPQGSNCSKPYQAQLAAALGFLIPPTLITSVPELVHAFWREHARIVYKSMSGVRSVVQEFSTEDLGRLERIAWCPVQFQVLIEGTNIRVHVIGEKLFATEIQSTHVDYRYARKHGGETHLRAATLPADLSAKCLELTRGMQLAFAGIDLMRTPAGQYYCFEVNPQPAFSYFESNTGQPIAAAVARYLMGGE